LELAFLARRVVEGGWERGAPCRLEDDFLTLFCLQGGILSQMSIDMTMTAPKGYSFIVQFLREGAPMMLYGDAMCETIFQFETNQDACHGHISCSLVR